MNIPKLIRDDIDRIRRALAPHIVHYGVFGSFLSKGAEDARDIDLLFIYDGTTFEEVKEKLRAVKLAYPYAISYRNYSRSIALPPVVGRYYDLIFMPEKKPDRKFMEMNEHEIVFLTDPFVSWKKGSIRQREAVAV